jgi:hypothetical protein
MRCSTPATTSISRIQTGSTWSDRASSPRSRINSPRTVGAPADIGIEANPGNPTAPIRGVALPVLGVVAFVEHKWSEKFASSVGYSLVEIDNSGLQAPDAFGRGQYALGNVRYSSVPGVMTGVELQWGDRENFSDGFSSSVARIQFSAKYNFSRTW